MNYFVFNKASDYRRGDFWNVEFDDDGLWIKDSRKGEPGVFLSRLLDCEEKETVWHRLTLDLSKGGNMAVTLGIYGSDEVEEARLCRSGFREEMEACFRPDGSCGTEGNGCYEGAVARMKGCLKQNLLNPVDFLLWDVKARYLWFTVLLQGTTEGGPRVGNVTVYFPKKSWISYLPEVYQTRENSFLERFLAVFQVLYGELEHRIRSSHEGLYPGTAGVERLLWLAGWLDMDHVHLWPPEHLKRYLAKGAESFLKRGTGTGLVEMAEAYTGERVYLKEGMDKEAGSLTLYVPGKSVAHQAQYRALLLIAEAGKPADVQVRIVALLPRIRLDYHTYLGINSWISSYQTAALNGAAQLGMVLAGGRK